DSVSLDPARAREVAVYFKLQHRKGGYGIDNVVPGGYVPASSEIYGYLPYLRALRDRRRFRQDVAGRFGLQAAADVRRRAMGALAAQTRLSYGGGAKLRYSRSLVEIATSRVCVDLPGNGPLCFRLVDYLAVGA